MFKVNKPTVCHESDFLCLSDLETVPSADEDLEAVDNLGQQGYDNHDQQTLDVEHQPLDVNDLLDVTADFDLPVVSDREHDIEYEEYEHKFTDEYDPNLYDSHHPKAVENPKLHFESKKEEFDSDSDEKYIQIVPDKENIGFDPTVGRSEEKYEESDAKIDPSTFGNVLDMLSGISSSEIGHDDKVIEENVVVEQVPNSISRSGKIHKGNQSLHNESSLDMNLYEEIGPDSLEESSEGHPVNVTFDDTSLIIHPNVSTSDIDDFVTSAESGIKEKNEDIYEYDPEDYDYFNYTTEDHYPTLYGGKFDPSLPGSQSIKEKNDKESKLLTTVGDDDLSTSGETESTILKDTLTENNSEPSGTDISPIKLDNQEIEDYFPYNYYDYEYLSLDNETEYDLTYFPNPIYIDEDLSSEDLLPLNSTIMNTTELHQSIFKVNETLQLQEETLKKRHEELLEKQAMLENERGNISRIQELANRIKQVSDFIIGTTQNEIYEDTIRLKKKEDSLDAEEEFIAQKELEMDPEGSGVGEDVIENLNEVVYEIELKKDEIDREKINLKGEELLLVENERTIEENQEKINKQLDEVEDQISTIEEKERKVQENLINIENNELDAKVHELENERDILDKLKHDVVVGEEDIQTKEEILDVAESDLVDESEMTGVMGRELEAAKDDVLKEEKDVLGRGEILKEEKEELEEEHAGLINIEETLKAKDRVLNEEIEEVEEKRDDIVDRGISIAIEENKLDEEEAKLHERKNDLYEKEENLDETVFDMEELEENRAIDREILKEEELLQEEKKRLEEDQIILEEEGLILVEQAEEIAVILDEMDTREEDLLMEKSFVDKELKLTQEEEEMVDVLEHGIKERNESLIHEEELLEERDLIIHSEEKSIKVSENEFFPVIDGIDFDEETLLEKKVEQDLLESEVQKETKKIEDMKTEIINEETKLEKEEDSLPRPDDDILVINENYFENNSTDLMSEVDDGSGFGIYDNEVNIIGDIENNNVTNMPHNISKEEFIPISGDLESPSEEDLLDKSRPPFEDVEISLTTDETAQESFDGTLNFTPRSYEDIMTYTPDLTSSRDSIEGSGDAKISNGIDESSTTPVAVIIDKDIVSSAEKVEPTLSVGTIDTDWSLVDEELEDSNRGEKPSDGVTEPSPDLPTDAALPATTTESAGTMVVPGSTAGTIRLFGSGSSQQAVECSSYWLVHDEFFFLAQATTVNRQDQFYNYLISF